MIYIRRFTLISYKPGLSGATMATHTTCPVCGKPTCRPPSDYFCDLVDDCYEELAVRNHLPHPFRIGPMINLEDSMITYARTIFCRLHQDWGVR